MSPSNPLKKPARRPPGRPVTQDPLQSSAASQSAPEQACSQTPSQLLDAPQRPTEPQIVQQPQLTSDYQPFAVGGLSFDLTQPFPPLGRSSALDTTPIDPQLSSAGSHFPNSTQTAPFQPQANPTTDTAISSTSQVTAREQPQSTTEEQGLTLPSITVQTSNQFAPPVESTATSEGVSEQPPPAAGKRAQKAQPKKPRKRNIDQVDGQPASGPAGKKRATEKFKEQPKEQSKEQPKRSRKRNVEQVDDQSTPEPAAKKRATGKPKEQSKEKPKEKPIPDPLANILPKVFEQFTKTSKSRVKEWTQIFAKTVVEQVQADARDQLDNLRPPRIQPAPPVDLTRDQPPEEESDEEHPAGYQPAAYQPTGDQFVESHPAESHPARDQPTKSHPAENQPAREQSTTMPEGDQPQGVPASNPTTTSDTQPEDPAIKSPGHYADKDTRRKLKIGNSTLARAGLGLPHFLTREEIHRRVCFIDETLQLQRTNAPILPPSELTQPGPKPFTPKPYKVPASIKDSRVRSFFDKKNHDLCTKNKQIDLDRNNQAAKGTRSRREEALDQYRQLANEQAIELNWWRIKAVSLGADYREWDQVPGTVKTNMTTEMSERVKKLEAAAAKEAKKQRSAIHSARTKENARLSKEDEARKKKEVQEVAAAYAAEDYALIEKMADPDYQATIPESSSTAAGGSTTANSQNANREKSGSVVDQDTETNTAANVTAAVTTQDTAEPTKNLNVTTTMAPDNNTSTAAPDNIAPGSMAPNNMASDIMDLGSMDFCSMNFSVPPDNEPSYNMPSFNMPSDNMPSGNTLDFGNSAQVNIGIAPTQFNASPGVLYGCASVENPTYPNTQNNTFGNVQTQQQQSSNLPQGTSNYHELRRQPSNVTMLDAQPETIQPLDPNMGAIMDQTSPYWESTGAPGSTALPSNIDPSFQGPMGDVSTLPPNNMSHNINGPMGDANLFSTNDIGQNSDGLTNSVSLYSEEDALFNAFLPSFQKNQDQNKSITNDKGSTNEYDINADSSTYPDPVEECNMSRWINLSP
ncbi:hypothetical protein FLAG1_03628 [Fusarium langsethiae]|uniref:Uncharacterized protein n=1 Tax=Fusarium langsethiae TaxID=179993 RepID=A0A0M9F058_FUSLA|nr:hypothetical protein FLAG1_03628 [Fusarium langsethiae]GKU01688.1 unnamed protein product [Fusarium langsethiae]